MMSELVRDAISQELWGEFVCVCLKVTVKYYLSFLANSIIFVMLSSSIVNNVYKVLFCLPATRVILNSLKHAATGTITYFLCTLYSAFQCHAYLVYSQKLIQE